MTKPWKLKINLFNTLLVLVILILIKAERSNCETIKSWEKKRNRTSDGGQATDAVQMLVGNSEIAEYYFESSESNSSLILSGVNRCLNNFQLLTCMKMLLLNKIDNAIEVLRKPSVAQVDIPLMNGLLSFKLRNNTSDGLTRSDAGDENNNEVDGLDGEISDKFAKMFENRFLRINLSPTYKLDITPADESGREDFICFRYRFHRVLDDKNENSVRWEGRKKKKGGMSMMMMIPQMIMLGFMPFTLASLKAMVMNAVMINMMALNGAIFMTIRNLVFGPREHSNVQYVNYGYSKDRQNQKKRPVLIIHSPAAFVKQPDYPITTNYHRRQGQPPWMDSQRMSGNPLYPDHMRRMSEGASAANRFHEVKRSDGLTRMTSDTRAKYNDSRHRIYPPYREISHRNTLY